MQPMSEMRIFATNKPWKRGAGEEKENERNFYFWSSFFIQIERNERKFRHLAWEWLFFRSFFEIIKLSMVIALHKQQYHRNNNNKKAEIIKRKLSTSIHMRTYVGIG